MERGDFAPQNESRRVYPRSLVFRETPMPACRSFADCCFLVGLIVLGISGLVRVSPAADWPGLRGAGQDGISQGETLADAWPVGGPPIL